MVRGFRICSNNKDILDARSATKAPRFLLREENMADAKKLSSMDASFLYLETPEMPMHVGSMAIFRLPENYNGNFFEDFKAMIASRLHIAPILKAASGKGAARHRSSVLGRGRPVRHRPSHLPRQPAGAV
jgi:hypothetical protein